MNFGTRPGLSAMLSQSARPPATRLRARWLAPNLRGVHGYGRGYDRQCSALGALVFTGRVISRRVHARIQPAPPWAEPCWSRTALAVQWSDLHVADERGPRWSCVPDLDEDSSDVLVEEAPARWKEAPQLEASFWEGALPDSEWCAVYINLARRPDRREELLNKLELSPQLLQHIRRIEAVDGRDLTLRDEALSQVVDEQALDRARHARRRGAYTIVHSGGRLLHFDNHLTLGGIACAMSHRLALQAVVQHPTAKWGIILEDDIAAAVPRAEEVVARMIGTLPADWDALFLGFHDDAGRAHEAAYDHAGAELPEVPVRPMREPCFGLFAWAVRKEAAEALLANAFPIGGQVDHAISSWLIRERGQCFQVEPGSMIFFSPKSEEAEDSDIQTMATVDTFMDRFESWQAYYVVEMNNEAMSPKSVDSTGSRRGVCFRTRESVVEIDGRLMNGKDSEEPSRKVKSRKPTAFAAAPVKGVGFQDDDDAEEVEVDKTPKRKVHGRKPTAFVPNKANADVNFDDDAEDIEVEEEDSAGPKRAVHGRKATAFVPKKTAKASASVEFEEEEDDVEEVEVDKTPQRKVKGRQATAFVPKAPSQSGVYFEENNDEVEVEEEDDVPKRTTHGRKATAFVPKSKGKASAVNFEEEDEDVEEVEVEKTPKRSVHGRQATSFVPKSKARVGQVGFNEAAEQLDAEDGEEDGEDAPKRSAKSRKATAFVPKSRAAAGVSFDDDADQLEVEDEGGQKRTTHGRKPTAFIPKSGAGKVVSDDEDEPEEVKASVPKLRLADSAEDGGGESSPSKRGVRFRGNDSVNEMHEGEGVGQASSTVRKRVPTRFVAEKVKEEEEEDHHGGVSFADEVSEPGTH
ncbi:unnamed protein product [Effrenium voratum]|nr:unnamed protein product [Effrenium voratum]